MNIQPFQSLDGKGLDHVSLPAHVRIGGDTLPRELWIPHVEQRDIGKQHTVYRKLC